MPARRATRRPVYESSKAGRTITLVQSYGESFAAELEAGEVRRLASDSQHRGLRAVRLLSIAPHKPASFDDLRGVILQDWTDAVMAEQRSAAVAGARQEIHRQSRGSE